MTLKIELVVDVGVDRSELLERLHSSESQHRPLPSTQRQMTVLDDVVGVPADLLLAGRTQLPESGLVGFQAIGHDRFR